MINGGYDGYDDDYASKLIHWLCSGPRRLSQVPRKKAHSRLERRGVVQSWMRQPCAAGPKELGDPWYTTPWVPAFRCASSASVLLRCPIVPCHSRVHVGAQSRAGDGRAAHR